MGFTTTFFIVLALIILLFAVRIRRVTIAIALIFLCLIAGLIFRTISGLVEIFTITIILAIFLLYMLLRKK
ncbi:MAG: hypothetical protein N3F64_00505 [Nitrososphaeria archaeon]|nr:hypothetical protein [Nitrososphaeria archaeon]